MLQCKHVPIRNKIYSMDVFIYESHIFVSNYSITTKYRGRRYSYRIFSGLLRRFGRDVVLESFKTLLPYYHKLGFKTIEGEDEQGYYVMNLSKKI